jgi:carbamoyltransferase
MSGWLLGLGGSDHDFSAALMHGNDIRVAIEQERLTRVRYGQALWFRDPVAAAADYCLSDQQIGMDHLEAVVGTDTLPARVRENWRGKDIVLFPHHLAHAASAYLLMPPGSRAGIVVYDGYGSLRGNAANPAHPFRETVSLYRFGPDGVQRIGGAEGESRVEDDDFPMAVTNSIGMFYELVTELLGYGPMDGGKTMGLAAYGVPRHADSWGRFFEFRQDPQDCFRCATDDPELVQEIEAALRSGHNFCARADVAATAQHFAEKALQHCLSFFANADVDFLGIAGGCALNSVANGKAATTLNGERKLIAPPHAGDAGLAFGALWLARQQGGGLPALSFRGGPPLPAISRPGRCYTPLDCRQAVGSVYPRVAYDRSISAPGDLAHVLAGSEIVGLFRGSSEFGPRALGGRSILADPRAVSVREKINRSLKHREPFRPLAPMVLASRYDRYFEGPARGDPFMLTVVAASQLCCRQAPAAVHVDGTARVQVIDDGAGDPFLVELLRAFEEKTGVGILLNTSFNRRGEPIVETPLDAIDAFLGLRLDGLLLETDFYRPA